MPVFTGQPKTVAGRNGHPGYRGKDGGGGGGISLTQAILGSILIQQSSTNADGSTDTFPMPTPIGTLLAGVVGGGIIFPGAGSCSVVGGALKLLYTPLPGDPANPTAIKVGAIFLP